LQKDRLQAAVYQLVQLGSLMTFTSPTFGFLSKTALKGVWFIPVYTGLV
jgi:hypothetical protein